MEQSQYQSYSEPVGFRPVRQPDIIPELDREAKRQANARAGYLQGLQRNEAVEVQNARRFGEGLSDLGKGLKSVASFSATLQKKLVEEENEKIKEDYAAGLNAGYMDYINKGVDLKDYRATENQLKEQNQVAQNVASNVLGDDGENFEAANAISTGTGAFSIARKRSFAMAAVGDYSTFMDDRLSGQTFNSSAEFAAARANARAEFFKASGLTGLSSRFLAASGVYQTIAKADATANRKWSKQFGISTSQDTQSEARSAFLGDFDIASYHSILKNTLGTDGNPLGNAGAWNMITKTLTDARKGGLLSATDLERMKSQVIPAGSPGAGKTYGEFYKARFGEIERAVRQQTQSDYNLSQQEKQRQMKEFEENMIDSFISEDGDGFTDDQIEKAQETYIRISGGQRSQRLDNLKRLTVDTKTKNDQEKQIEQMIKLGILTEQELAKFHPDLQKTYRSTAQQQGKALRDNNNFKTQTDAIKDAVEYVANVSPMTRKHPSVGLKVAQLQEEFRTNYQDKVLGGMDAATAAQSAMTEVLTKFQANPGWDKQAGFSGVLGGASPQAQAAAEDQALAITETLQEQGSAGLDKTDTFFDEATLEDMSKGFGKPGFTYDPRLLFIADKLGISPLDVLRRQRKAYGMVEIPPTPAEEIIQNELTPEQRTLLNTTPSVERSQRGMTGVKTFNASLLPSKAQPYAQQIDIAASSYDIPPAILAGLLETESSWNPAAISRVGARGLAQFMPATAAEMGVTNPNDPMQAIDGAAKYLRHLMDNYGFDLNTAIKAYNGGPGGIDKSQENREYLPKVLKSAGKYGYGAQTLQEPSVVRASSPVLAYISGNIGPTSTGPHLDVKQVGGGRFEETALDEFVEVDDPEFGRVSLGEIRKRTGGLGDNFDQHVARGSHGIDYGLHSGTKVYVKNGAKVVGTRPSEHGDVTTIQLPNGKQYTFIHGTKA